MFTKRKQNPTSTTYVDEHGVQLFIGSREEQRGTITTVVNIKAPVKQDTTDGCCTTGEEHIEMQVKFKQPIGNVNYKPCVDQLYGVYLNAIATSDVLASKAIEFTADHDATLYNECLYTGSPSTV
jgi:hypothetical protein